jgi:tetratricopeptide (TPR) repeat protein
MQPEERRVSETKVSAEVNPAQPLDQASQRRQFLMQPLPGPLSMLLSKWWAIFAFVGLVVVGDVVQIALTETPDHWIQGVVSQVSTVAMLLHDHPAPTIAGLMVVLALSVLGWREQRAVGVVQQEMQDKLLRHQYDEHKRDIEARVEQAAVRIFGNVKPIPREVVAPTGMRRPVSLVGRDDIVETIVTDLRSDAAPGAVALRGMGGVGKSAIASEAVARLATDSSFPGGAAWIQCKNLHGPKGLAQLWTLIARSLEFDDIAKMDDSEKARVALAAELIRGPRRLLALDSLEPDLDIDDLLTTLAIPGRTALLLTAQQTISQDRVQTFAVGPLPDLQAEQLFFQRLRQSDVTRPNEQDHRDVSALISCVGGLPLALELTAAFAGVQGAGLATLVQEIKAEGIDALVLRNDPERAIPATFDRSWAILTPVQRRLFAGLALFADASFPRSASLALAATSARIAGLGATAGDGGSSSAAAVAALVSYSLVDPLPNDRLQVPPLLHEYAVKRLREFDHTVEDELATSLGTYWLGVARARPRDGADPVSEQEGVFQSLTADEANVMKTLDWLIDHDHLALVADLTHSLRIFWRDRGRWKEGVRFLPKAMAAEEDRLRALGSQDGRRELAELKLTYGQILVYSGEPKPGETEIQGSLDAFRNVHDRRGEGLALLALGEAASWRGQYSQAEAFFRQSLSILREVHSRAEEGQALLQLGEAAVLQLKLSEGEDWLKQAQDILREEHDQQGEGAAVTQLGSTAARRGNFDQAEASLHQGIAIFEQLKDRQSKGVALNMLGRVAVARGQFDQAEECFHQSFDIFSDVGDRLDQGVVLGALGEVALGRGLVEQAESLLRKSIDIAEDVSDLHTKGVDLNILGRAALRRGQVVEAADLARQALDIARSVGDHLGEIRCQLTLGRAEEARNDPDQAVDLYRNSLVLATSLGVGPEIARAELALGLLLVQRSPSRDEGCSCLLNSVERFTEMKMPEAGEARTATERFGCRTDDPSPSSDPSGAP